MGKLYRQSLELEQNIEREPTTEELAEITQKSPDWVDDLIKVFSEPVSLDEPIGNSETALLQLMASNDPRPEAMLMKVRTISEDKSNGHLTFSEEYPNLVALRNRFKAFIKDDRVGFALSINNLSPIKGRLTEDQVKALKTMEEVSYEIVRTLHRLGPDGESSKSCLWTWEKGDPIPVARKNPLTTAILNISHIEDLQDAQLPYVKAAGCMFAEGVNMKYASLQGAILDNAHLQGAGLNGAHLQGANLNRAQLQKAHLDGAQLQGAILEDAHLQGANLMRTHLQGAILYKAKLQGAGLFAAHLQEAHLSDAQLQGASLPYAQLQNAYLDDAQLQGAYLFHAQLKYADLAGAQLQGANLGNAQLQIARLRSAQLQGADLREARLQGAAFDDAQLQGANLNHSHLSTGPIVVEFINKKEIIVKDFFERPPAYQLSDSEEIYELPPAVLYDVQVGTTTLYKLDLNNDSKADALNKFQEGWHLSEAAMKSIRFSEDNLADLGLDRNLFTSYTTQPTSFLFAEIDGIYVNEDQLPQLEELVGKSFDAVTSKALIQKRWVWTFPRKPIGNTEKKWP